VVPALRGEPAAVPVLVALPARRARPRPSGTPRRRPGS